VWKIPTNIYADMYKFITSIPSSQSHLEYYKNNSPVFVHVCRDSKDGFRTPMYQKRHCLLSFNPEITANATYYGYTGITSRTAKSSAFIYNFFDLDTEPTLKYFINYCSIKSNTIFNALELVCYVADCNYISGMSCHWDGFQVKFGSSITAISFGEENSSTFIKTKSPERTYNLKIPIGFAYEFSTINLDNKTDIYPATLLHGRRGKKFTKDTKWLSVAILREFLPFTVSTFTQNRFFNEAAMFSQFQVISHSHLFQSVFGNNTYPKEDTLQWVVLHKLNPNLLQLIPDNSLDVLTNCWKSNTIFPNNNALLALLGLHTKISHAPCFDCTGNGVTAVRSQAIWLYENHIIVYLSNNIKIRKYSIYQLLINFTEKKPIRILQITQNYKDISTVKITEDSNNFNNNNNTAKNKNLIFYRGISYVIQVTNSYVALTLPQ